MRPRSRAPGGARLLLVAVLAASLHGCVAPLPLDHQWIEVQSQNFTITSDMKPAGAQALARSLELFRAAVLRMTDSPSSESSVPTRIFFFKNLASFSAFQPQRTAMGYFLPTIRVNFTAIVDSEGFSTEEFLKHEYVHFLIRNGSRLIYPRWFDEGFAELLSTMDVYGEHVAVGGLPSGRIEQLRSTPWIPLVEILQYDGSMRWPGVRLSMFYAQSWALLHYFMRDQEGRAVFAASMRTYLASIEQGASVRDATEAAFGMSTRDLDKALRDHLEHGFFEGSGVPLAALQWSPESRTRRLSRAEAAERLGELALLRGDTVSAQKLFAAALADDPANARAHAGMGDVHKMAQQWSEAESSFARAVELEPDDPLNQLDFGEYWQTRARINDDDDERHEMLRRARRHYVRGYKLDDSRPEPYVVYGSSFLLPGEDPSEGVQTLEHAASLLPSSVDIRLELATAYVEVGRREDARPLLRRILAWSHEGGMADTARELLDRIDGAPLAGENASPQ